MSSICSLSGGLPAQAAELPSRFHRPATPTKIPKFLADEVCQWNLALVNAPFLNPNLQCNISNTSCM